MIYPCEGRLFFFFPTGIQVTFHVSHLLCTCFIAPLTHWAALFFVSRPQLRGSVQTRAHVTVQLSTFPIFYAHQASHHAAFASLQKWRAQNCSPVPKRGTSHSSRGVEIQEAVFSN